MWFRKIGSMVAVTPQDVMTDPDLQARFAEEFALRDGAARTAREAAGGTPPLTLRTVAWLWPDRTYDTEFDPFDPADERCSRRAEEWREWLAAELRHAILVVQDAVERDTTALLEYLMWSLRMSRRELIRVLDGCYHLEWIDQVLSALHLEFQGSWAVRDPEHLARRIEQARLASEISDHLRHLTINNLANLIKHNKIPAGHVQPEQPKEPVVYQAPALGSRYRALYEVLAYDERDRPTLMPEDLSRRMVEIGGDPLPVEAIRDSSWWSEASAGSGTPTQAAAWRAAGYRLDPEAPRLVDTYRRREVVLPDGERVTVKAWSSKSVLEPLPESDSDSTDVTTEVVGVVLRALPGRDQWLTDPERVGKGAYRTPSLVPVPPRPREMNEAPDLVADLQTPPPAPEPPAPVELKPDVRNLVERLAEVGEADAATMKQLLPDQDPDEFAKLLARARRARIPAVRNFGSRTRPRWVAVGSKGDHVIPIARALWFSDHPELVPHVGPGPELPDWFTRLVQEASREGCPELASAEADHPFEARAIRAALDTLAAELRGTGSPDTEILGTLLEALGRAVDDLVTVRLVESF